MQTGQNVLDKKCLIFPYCLEIDSETALQYNSISPSLSHIYFGGLIASFIPQVYNYVRKYVFLAQHHMYSLAINTITPGGGGALDQVSYGGVQLRGPNPYPILGKAGLGKHTLF